MDRSTHAEDGGADGASSKKPRFDSRNPAILAQELSDEDEDSILDLDAVGKAQSARRNAVNLDGFDSDSEPDATDARAAKRAKERAASKKQRGDDIFKDMDQEGSGDDDDDEDEEAGPHESKKAVRFLGLEDIEGQEENSKSGGHVAGGLMAGQDADDAADASESSSEGASDEEERARVDSDLDEELGAGGKKRHAPRLDAFNMKSENNEGRFDENFNFVRKAADPEAVHDSWLSGVSKKEMKRAARMHELREEEFREREKSSEAIPSSQHLATLIVNLRQGETTLEALQRHHANKPALVSKNKHRKKQQPGAVGHHGGADVEDAAAESARMAAIDAISQAADQLSIRGLPGVTDIYDTERELLTRHYKRDTGKAWVDDADAKGMWEFRWRDQRDGGAANGPFTSQQLTEWSEAGYFDGGVEYRRAGDDEWDSDFV